MAFTQGGFFRQFWTDFIGNPNSFWTPALPHLDLETHKVALYGNAVTVDLDATAANTAYNAGTWVTGNEIAASGTYSAAGALLLNTVVSNVTGGITKWTADSLTFTGFTGTPYGCLIYANALTAPVAKQGISAVYFGGPVPVTAGTLTIAWPVDGILSDR